VDEATGLLTEWNPDANDPVWTLSASGNLVCVGGDFTSVSGLPQSYLAVVGMSVLGVPAPLRERNLTMLQQNRPNPFRARTGVRFALPAAEDVTLAVYDVAGRQVATLIRNERLAPGAHQVQFDGDGLPPGVYVCRLRAGRAVDTTTMVLVR
jgi:hypothetical protein